jgi:hypothetical protein
MIGYIAKQMPDGAQIILGIETPTEETFDQTIVLNEPYHLLNGEDFEEVDKLLQPYVDAMYLNLLNTTPNPS